MASSTSSSSFSANTKIVGKRKLNSEEYPSQERSRLRGRPTSRNAARERSRVHSLQRAFLELQNSLRTVPPNTKLSKLDILVLATAYISDLTNLLAMNESHPAARDDHTHASAIVAAAASNGHCSGEWMHSKGVLGIGESSLLHPIKDSVGGGRFSFCCDLSKSKMEFQSPYYSEGFPSMPDVSVSEFLLGKVEEILTKNGDKVFVRDLTTSDTIRYSELEPLSRRVGSALTRRGFKAQDTLMLVTFNCCRVYPFFFGVWRLNGIIRPSYPEDTEETLLSRMKESHCAFVLCEASTAPAVLSVCHQLDWPVQVLCLDHVDSCIHVDLILQDDGSALPDTVQVHPDDIAVVLCTGGTTGPSKGAVFTHRRFLACLAVNKWLFPNITSGKMLITIRVFHMSGSVIVAMLLTRGLEVLLMSVPTPETLLKGIHQHGPSYVGGFPTSVLWAATHSSDREFNLSSVKCVSLGGAPITQSIMNAVRKAYPSVQYIHRAYGLTEGYLVASTVDPMVQTAEDKESPEYEGTPAESCGKLFVGVKLKIVDCTTGKMLGPNEAGEILIKGPTVMKNYYKNPEETAKSFRNGWLLTGDYGYIDENGFLFCLDRLKESFKYWNYHISPAEIEDVIMKHPEVSEACVIGIPDPEGGDSIPRAYVVKKEGSILDEQAIEDFVHAQIASYKRLRGGVAFLDEIPKSAAGKVSRILARNMFKQGVI